MSAPLPDTAGAHRLDAGGQGTSEPVVLAHGVTTVLYAIVGAGWLVIPDKTIDIIGTVVAVVLATVGVLAARARVSPNGRITWDGVRGTIRAMVYEEIDRLADAAPALTAGALADAFNAAALPPTPAAVSLDKTLAPPAPPADAEVTAAIPAVPVAVPTAAMPAVPPAP